MMAIVPETVQLYTKRKRRMEVRAGYSVQNIAKSSYVPPSETIAFNSPNIY
jgi:hypothetical protein